MSKRLKSLRDRRDEGSRSIPEDSPPPYAAAVETKAQPQPQPTEETGARTKAGEDGPGGQLGEDEDKTLDEILDSLVLEDDHWSVSEDGGEDESKKVEDLLAKLKDDPAAQPPATTDEAHQEADEDDDSDGDEMSRKVNDVLSRTMDELDLEGHIEAPDDGTARAPAGEDTGKDLEDSQDPEDSPLALPAVPQTPTRDDPPLPDLPPTPQDAKKDPTDLSLPAVPTLLQDPVPASKAGDPFESSIAARLAALKGPGHRPIATDSFGLPSAPTFQPEDRGLTDGDDGEDGGGKRLRSAGRFTDDDQKTWCVVCLEDATVRCVGCGGDVYCARCWREMHVGPAAGWDERGHRWEKFDPRGLR